MVADIQRYLFFCQGDLSRYGLIIFAHCISIHYWCAKLLLVAHTGFVTQYSDQLIFLHHVAFKIYLSNCINHAKIFVYAKQETDKQPSYLIRGGHRRPWTSAPSEQPMRWDETLDIQSHVPRNVLILPSLQIEIQQRWFAEVGIANIIKYNRQSDDIYLGGL